MVPPCSGWGWHNTATARRRHRRRHARRSVSSLPAGAVEHETGARIGKSNVRSRGVVGSHGHDHNRRPASPLVRSRPTGAMNHLAHALLAGDDALLQLGGLLGDFVRGRPDPASARARDCRDSPAPGHRQSSPTPMPRCWPPRPCCRRPTAAMPVSCWTCGSIIAWRGTFHAGRGMPLAAFLRAMLQALLRRHDGVLTPDLRRFRGYMERQRLPAGYADPQRAEHAPGGDRPAPASRQSAGSAHCRCCSARGGTAATFRAFFPQRAGFAQEWIRHGRRLM